MWVRAPSSAPRTGACSTSPRARRGSGPMCSTSYPTCAMSPNVRRRSRRPQLSGFPRTRTVRTFAMTWSSAISVQRLQHRWRDVERDDATTRPIERTCDWQREAAGARPPTSSHVRTRAETNASTPELGPSGRRGKGTGPGRRNPPRPGSSRTRSTCSRFARTRLPTRLDRSGGSTPVTGTSTTSSGWAARTGPRPRSPRASTTRPNAGRPIRTGFRAASSS